MSDTIIVAILGFIGSCIGSLAGIGLIKYRLEQLEKKVEKHNSVVERTSILEKEFEMMQQDVNELKNNSSH